MRLRCWCVSVVKSNLWLNQCDFRQSFKSTKLLWTTNLSCGRGRYSLAGVLRLLRGQVVKTETWLRNHELNTHRWSFGNDRFQPTGKPTKSQWPTAQLHFRSTTAMSQRLAKPNIANIEIKSSNTSWAPDWVSLRFFLTRCCSCWWCSGAAPLPC